MKPIRFSLHAEERLAARKLRHSTIEQVVRNPEQIVPDEDDINRQIHQSLIEESGKQKLLRVIVEEDSSEIVVITVYSTSQITRYWK
ncbi:MAG: DUF4258 domain-containing protein [Ignavibacteriae bacterium]|nr:DUF4258 domain-containing protein [Ignavibacteriota bacterium]